MSQSNLISAEIPEQVKSEILTKLAEVSNLLANTLIFNLTGQERMEMYKMGDKSQAFVEKSLEYASTNPTLVPTYLDLPEAKKDLKLFQDLGSILKQVSTLQRAVEDTMMVAGSEAYDGGLVFYASVKGASRVNVPGSEAISDDLQKRYIAKSKKKDEQK